MLVHGHGTRRDLLTTALTSLAIPTLARSLVAQDQVKFQGILESLRHTIFTGKGQAVARLSGDGSYLASVALEEGGSSVLKLWDRRGGRAPVLRLSETPSVGERNYLAMTHDGNLLLHAKVVGQESPNIVVEGWKIDRLKDQPLSAKNLWKSSTDGDQFSSLTASPSNDAIAYCVGANVIVCKDVTASGSPDLVIKPQSEKSQCRSLSFSTDGKIVYVGQSDGSLSWHSVEDGSRIGNIKLQSGNQIEEVVAIGEDRLILSAGQLILANLGTPTKIVAFGKQSLTEPVVHVVDNYLFSASRKGGVVRVWNLAAEDPFARSVDSLWLNQRIAAVSGSKDTITVSQRGGRVDLFKIKPPQVDAPEREE